MESAGQAQAIAYQLGAFHGAFWQAWSAARSAMGAPPEVQEDGNTLVAFDWALGRVSIGLAVFRQILLNVMRENADDAAAGAGNLNQQYPQLYSTEGSKNNENILVQAVSFASALLAYGLPTGALSVALESFAVAAQSTVAGSSVRTATAPELLLATDQLAEALIELRTPVVQRISARLSLERQLMQQQQQQNQSN